MKIGLIGCGRMGGALLEGALRANIVSPEDVWVHSRSAESATAMAEKLGVTVADSNSHVIRSCDLVLLGCKPYQVIDVLGMIKIGEALPNHVLLVVAKHVCKRRIRCDDA